MIELIVDGYISGTGIRDKWGYVSLERIPLNDSMIAEIRHWLDLYQAEMFAGYCDITTINDLDSTGIELARRIETLLPFFEVSYFSDAKMVGTKIEQRNNLSIEIEKRLNAIPYIIDYTLDDILLLCDRYLSGEIDVIEFSNSFYIMYIREGICGKHLLSVPVENALNILKDAICSAKDTIANDIGSLKDLILTHK